ncbi:MAG: transcription antitermination factor NusB [Firmicutes bacterium GWF2_51_9]|nr:transcription antitermination factor NusB [Erysipelotrichaceae bacterium]OGS53331.1 MAG: transcription antitermination factor NusB [Firmicutes bacterium GWF2_51_9]OGS59076.1 MAG: transcription antitermination factor NusB [Firmicutes bacterium GWE2_51_13]HAM63862.1 transcription antitermination factor NusB [Erysipelotrichaceae bacterium]HAO60776.1 transcription antitermination factor NusB [Erysipelotrichaceae bacterium]
MKRHVQRRKAMECIYQHLLLAKEIQVVLAENMILGLSDEEKFVREICLLAIEHKKEHVALINARLKDWDFVRLGYIEQAILLLALGELALADVERTVIIDEAVELAKEFGDTDAYKLINGVLDQL